MSDVEEARGFWGSLLKETDYADVTFVVQGKEIRGHRVIIGLASAPLKAMLLGSWKESASKEVHISDPLVTPEAFEEFLRYIYTRQALFNPRNCFCLHHLGSLYDVPSLVASSNSYLKNLVTTANCLDVLHQARLWGNDNMVDKALSVLAPVAATVLAQPHDLAEVNEQAMLDLVGCDDLKLGEMEIFGFVAKWLEVNPKSSLRGEILGGIRFGCMSLQDLAKKVKPTSLVPTETLMLALCLHGDPDLPCPPKFKLSRGNELTKLLRGLEFLPNYEEISTWTPVLNSTNKSTENRASVDSGRFLVIYKTTCGSLIGGLANTYKKDCSSWSDTDDKAYIFFANNQLRFIRKKSPGQQNTGYRWYENTWGPCFGHGHGICACATNFKLGNTSNYELHSAWKPSAFELESISVLQPK